ncbi:MAG: phosphatidylserine/phosphatidylglycerophosphate/cardiolipin synthase family protein [Oligoflexales bacterium]
MRFLFIVATAMCASSCQPVRMKSTIKSEGTMSPYMEAISASVLGAEPSKGTVGHERIVTMDNSVDLQPLISGPAIFPRMHDLILSAKREILVQFYVWDPSTEGHRVIMDAFEKLYAKEHDQKIQITILISNLMFLQTPAAATIDKQMKKLSNPMINYRVMTFKHFGFGALHSKTLIVDGHTGLITGANIQKFHQGDEPWFDLAFVVSGNVARGMREDILDAVLDARGVNLQRLGADERDKMLGESDLTWDAPAISAPEHTEGWAGGIPIVIMTRRAQDIPNNDARSPQDLGFLAAFENAQEIIKIQTPNLNDNAVKDAIVRAVRRGVKVDIILSKNFNFAPMMVPGQGGPNELNVPQLYNSLSDEERKLLDVRWYAFEPGVAVVDKGERRRSSHAKFASFDNMIAIVGSANMDTQSWNQSREINLAIDSPAVAQAWGSAIFDANFKKAVPVCTFEPKLKCD